MIANMIRKVCRAGSYLMTMNSKTACTLLFLLMIGLSPPLVTADSLAERHLVFYPTYGYRMNNSWVIPIRVWAKKDAGKVRRAAVKGARKMVRKIVGIDKLADAEKQLFKLRAEDFVADSKSGVAVEIVFHNDPAYRAYRLTGLSGKSRTDRNGLLEATIILSDSRVNELLASQNSTDGWLEFTAISDRYSGNGRIRMIPPTGLSVVSDIDDTVKITDIPAGEKAVLNNTFFKPFADAPCMAQTYQSFSTDTVFHYVSGGPWQLYAPIAGFLEDFGYPAGSVHMKNVRTNPFESASYRDLWKLVGGSGKATVEQKTAQIETLLSQFPERQFILIGDSGEHDPEIFRQIKQAHQRHIIEIRIRDVVDAKTTDPERLRDMTVVDASTSQCD